MTKPILCLILYNACLKILDIFLQAHELATLTGTQVMLLVASETGHVYTFATRKLQPILSSEAGMSNSLRRNYNIAY